MDTLKQRAQMSDGTRRFAARGRQFATDFAQHDAEDGALAFDGAAQALELFGVGVTLTVKPEIEALRLATDGTDR